MKYFCDAVRRKMEFDGWNVFRVRDSEAPIDLVCINKGGETTMVRARGNGHGHVNRDIESKLKTLSIRCRTHVLLAKVNAANEVVFRRIL